MEEIFRTPGWYYDEYDRIEDTSTPTPEDILIESTKWESLSKPAQYLIRLILKCPKEIEPLLKEFNNPYLSKQEFFSVFKIQRHLKNRGWAWKTITSTFQEIRDFLRSN